MIYLYLLPSASIAAYLLLTIASSFLVLNNVHDVYASDSSLQAALKKHPVNQEYDVFSADLLVTEFGNKKPKPGDHILAKNFQDLKFSWPASAGKRYALFLVDLDYVKNPSANVDNSPQQSTLSQQQQQQQQLQQTTFANNQTVPYNLYTVLNIPESQVSQGMTVAALNKPRVECQPGKTHKILFVVALQDQAIDMVAFMPYFSISGEDKNRENIYLPSLFKRHGLEPIAANLFLAQGEQNGVCSNANSAFTVYWPLNLVIIALIIVRLGIETR